MYPHKIEHDRLPRRSSSGIFIALFGLFLICGAWLGLWFFTENDFKDETSRIAAENSLISAAFEEHARRVLKTADNALLYLKKEFEETNEISQGMRNFAMLTKEDLSAVQVAIANEKGDLVYSAIPQSIPINITEREHFQAQKLSADVGLYIAKPVTVRLTGTSSFFLARRLNKKDGSFAGIVAIGLDPAYLSKVYDSITLGHDRSGLIVGNDHIVRVRISPATKMIGDDISKYSPVFREAAKSPVGSYELVSEVDNKPRLASYRQMPDYPLIVIVSTMKEAGLASFERRKSLSIVAVSLFTLFVAGFCYFLIRAEAAVNRKNLQLVQELTGRKKTEDELVETENLFSEFMNHMPAFVYLTDNKGDFLYNNNAFVKLIGQDMTGKNTAELPLPDKTAGKLAESAAKTLKEGNAALELTLPAGSDGVKTLEFAKFRFTRGDKPPYLGVIAMDVTDRKAAESERLEFERRMQQTQKMESLGILAGGIAHDFNNLLFGIVGNLDLALHEAQPDTPVYTALKRADSAAQRATELTNQMLAYSGRGQFVIEAVDLSTLVAEMIPLLHSVHSKLVTVHYDISDRLPPVKGDATQLRQVIMNLITNAADSCEGRPGLVEVRTHSGAGLLPGINPGVECVCLEIADNGCGMDEATRTRIFEPFFTTKKTGRGLGLAAAEGIIRGHGGSIHVESTPGRGTTIRVCLPATSETLASSAQAAKPVRAGQHEDQNEVGGRTVLVVDDEIEVLETAVEFLSLKGYEVLTAKDGVEAVEVFAKKSASISAVIIDMTMPRMGGAEAVRQLKQINSSVPIVLSSGYSCEDAVNHFKEDHIAGFLQKPYRLADLTAMLSELFKN